MLNARQILGREEKFVGKLFLVVPFLNSFNMNGFIHIYLNFEWTSMELIFVSKAQFQILLSSALSFPTNKMNHFLGHEQCSFICAGSNFRDKFEEMNGWVQSSFISDSAFHFEINSWNFQAIS